MRRDVLRPRHFTPDWLSASKEERKILFKFVARLIKERDLEWKEFFATALGISPGRGYEDNFRHGTIGKKNANRIYLWLRQHAPSFAHDVDAAILDAKILESGRNWQVFINTYGQFSHIGIIPAPKKPMGIVDFAKEEPIIDRPLSLGEKFLFRIDSPGQKTVLAFQSYKDIWYALPLSETKLWVAIEDGQLILPVSEDNKKPLPMSEETDIGKHGFVFLLVEKLDVSELCQNIKPGVSLNEEILNALSKSLMELEEGCLDVFRCNIQFIP